MVNDGSPPTTEVLSACCSWSCTNTSRNARFGSAFVTRRSFRSYPVTTCQHVYRNGTPSSMRTKPEALACFSGFRPSSRQRSCTHRNESSDRCCKTVAPELTLAGPPYSGFRSQLRLSDCGDHFIGHSLRHRLVVRELHRV